MPLRRTAIVALLVAEDVWLDEKGELVAVVTRDAELDHFEMARDGS
jgi:hypothetical protein